MDPKVLGKLKNLRARRLGTLTNTRRRALVIVNARGSRTEAISLMKELDTALDEVTQAHHEYLEALEDEDQKKTAQKTFDEASTSYNTTVDRIGVYLEERKDEPPSVISQAQQVSEHGQSGASAASSRAARDAEIKLRLKQLKLDQLNRQFAQEKEEDELRQRQLREQHDQEQRHRKHMAEAKLEAAKLEATLRKAAESSLAWERKNDFVDEEMTKTEPKLLAKDRLESNGQN